MENNYAKQREISDNKRLPKSLQYDINRDIHSSGMDKHSLRTSIKKNSQIIDTSNQALYSENERMDNKQKSRLHVQPAMFSDEPLSKRFGGSKMNKHTRRLKSMKRNMKGKAKNKMRSIKFIVPSRKKILSRTKDNEHVNNVFRSMNKQTLSTILSKNKIIKQDSKAPMSLMQDIANNVFTL